MDQKKPYYDHDFLWSKRASINHPVWGSNSLRVYRGALKLILQHCPTQQKKILDVGCGAGAFGNLLSAEGFEYIGIDASDVGICLGKKHFPNLTLAVADFAAKEVPNIASLCSPILTSINVLHCLVGTDHRINFLNNLYRASAADGTLVLTTMIGPVDEDAKEQRLPRAYLESAEIIQELYLAGWQQILFRNEEGRGAHSKIGNLTLVCRK